jgi:DNA-directed RNA polymerase specialized sigma24 family protein
MDQSGQPAVSPGTTFIDRHLEIVRPMAGRLARKLQVANELEDVVSTGMVGLIKAATTYDPERGTERFWAWACVRREILSAYACGSRQHSGGDGYRWATCRRPISTAVSQPAPASTPEFPPLPDFAVLTPIQQTLLRLIYEDGRSERAIAQERLIGVHDRNTVRARHANALERLRQVLFPRSAA